MSEHSHEQSPGLGADDLSAALRRRANSAVRRMGTVRAQRHRKEIDRLTAKLGDALNATAVQLFQVCLPRGKTPTAVLRHSAKQTGKSVVPREATKLRLPLRLLPTQIRSPLNSDKIVSLHASGAGSGRITSEIFEGTQADSYLLCPLHQGRHLRGLLGIALAGTHTFTRPELELIRLNGSILLNHVIRYRRDRKRKRRLRQWRKVVRQACDFAVTIDARQQILRTTPFRGRSVTGKLESLRLIDIVTRNFRRDLRDLIESSVENRQPRSCDLQLSFGHEGPRWHHVHIEPGEPDSRVYATLYFTDNTPDKLLEERVRELSDSLTKAARLSLLGQMSTEFAHQLNQPLQVILMYCTTAQKRLNRQETDPRKILDALGHIESSVTHATEIIQRIREFVKFRSLRKEEVPLNELLHHAVMMVLPSARDRNADLEAPAEIPDLIVQIDRPQTTQVLVNLMVNALEACCDSGLERPRVAVYVREDPKKRAVNVFVKDNGPGLPDDPNLVFKKFYTSKEEGLGLGLAISRDICESQGGSLRAFNNTSGTGCTFVARLPLLGASGHDTDELDIIRDVDLDD
ncbi:MAG: ATP-binding protein [Planctomycetaceae bacterium]|nr:ATP-binding protein [Planctomycetaceae bacterium]